MVITAETSQEKINIKDKYYYFVVVYHKVLFKAEVEKQLLLFGILFA